MDMSHVRVNHKAFYVRNAFKVSNTMIANLIKTKKRRVHWRFRNAMRQREVPHRHPWAVCCTTPLPCFPSDGLFALLWSSRALLSTQKWLHEQFQMDTWSPPSIIRVWSFSSTYHTYECPFSVLYAYDRSLPRGLHVQFFQSAYHKRWFFISTYYMRITVRFHVLYTFDRSLPVFYTYISSDPLIKYVCILYAYDRSLPRILHV